MKQSEKIFAETAPIRAGEELDAEALAPYLCERLGWEGVVSVRQFPGGNSNLTYLVRVGEREAVLRRPPFGNRVKSAHDMGREYRVLEKLHPVFPLAPRPYLYCEDTEVIGGPFYLMERRHGVVVREAVPEGLTFLPEQARTLSARFVDILAKLHTLDYDAAGLGDLGRPAGYVERQVRGWIKRWRNAQTDPAPEADEVIAWLEAGIPDETAAGLVHNDYKYDNVMLDAGDPTRIVAVFDWEMCTLGDPVMDFACALGYWTEATDAEGYRDPATSPTAMAGSLTRRALAARYGARTGFDLGNLDYYYVFALFRLAGILQQIYYRYHAGHTRDDRFAVKGAQALKMMRLAARAVETRMG